MSKTKNIFVCNNCGYESVKWLGRCPACSEWSSFVEEVVIKTKSKSISIEDRNISLKKIKEIEDTEIKRIKTGFNELDMVFGGGIVKGSLILVGGEPGIGKSTLILQLCDKIQTDGKIIYISGEESAEQVKLRAERLKIDNDNLYFMGETNIEIIQNIVENNEPKLVIIDSVQTMYSEEITSAAGSVSQVRDITSKIMRMCKEKNVTTVLIGHVTKDGNIAGPRVLEHMVDVVLYLEGERYFSYRILRGVKNRFGSTNEIGMFEMKNEGMVEISNPSSVFITEREEHTTGTVVIVTMEGTRPLLLELQVLVTKTVYPVPKRTANGVDYNKLNLLIAVLEKKLNIPLGMQDVYLNIIGGIKANEPAIDLGIVLAAVSSYKNIEIDEKLAVIGEVGLTGEVRSVNMIEKRLREMEKLGFKACIIPQNNKKLLKDKYKLDIIGVKNIKEAVNYILK